MTTTKGYLFRRCIRTEHDDGTVEYEFINPELDNFIEEIYSDREVIHLEEQNKKN